MAADKTDISSYSQLLAVIDEKPETIEKVSFINGRNAVEVTLKSGEPTREVIIPETASQSLLTALSQAGVKVEAKDSPKEGGGLSGFLGTFGPAILIVGVMLFIFMRRASGGSQGAFGNSKAKSLDKLGDSSKRKQSSRMNGRQS